MKIYAGYAAPNKKTYSIFEVEVTFIDNANYYRLCKPIFGRYGTSNMIVKKTDLDVVTPYWDDNDEDRFVISFDKEKVEKFVNQKFTEKMNEYKELEAAGIRRYTYEGE